MEHLLGDLGVGAGESGGAVIEDLSELDAYAAKVEAEVGASEAEDTPKAEGSVAATPAAETASSEAAVAGVIAKAEAYEAQDAPDKARKKAQLREQMSATRAKISGVKVAPDDPLATDKIKVANYLKKYGRTLDDLPAGFWDEPDRDVRGILLGEVVGPVMAERRSAKQLEKQLKRLIEAGYPADYYSRARNEQRQISSVVRKRRSRAKQATKPAPTPKAPLPTTMITKEWIRDSHTRLKSWTAGSDPMAIQLRGRVSYFVKVRNAYQGLINTLGRAPTQSELAAELGCPRWMAQNRIDQLRKLEGEGWPLAQRESVTN